HAPAREPSAHRLRQPQPPRRRMRLFKPCLYRVLAAHTTHVLGRLDYFGDVTNSDTTRIAHRQLQFAALHVHIPFTGCHHRRCSIRDRRSLEPTLTLIHDHARRIYVLPRLRVKHRLAFTVTRDLALVNHP